MARLWSFLPRLVALTVVWLLLTAALTYAAGKQLRTPATKAPPLVAPKQAPQVVVVPDVRGQAYVFAKGILEDAGFAWKVTGNVKGYAVNTVAGQVPAAGTRVLDTGTPTISIQLARGAYPQTGDPQEASPFAGTALKLADVAAAPKKAAAKKPVVVKKTPAATKPVLAKKEPAAKKPAKKAPQKRTPAFTFPGQRPEPLDEMPLPERARKLSAWLAGGPKPTDANVAHWLYQHAWVVTGAREGWWHGAEALRILIEGDRRAEQLWGIGTRSEGLARTALAEVEARAR